MAKSKFQKWLEPDGLLLLKAWARDGLTDEQIAHNMGITTSTFYSWKRQHQPISEAISRGKEVIDIEAENALFKSAIGYTITVKEPIKLKTVKQKAGEGKIEEERVEYVDREIHIPADVRAQRFWLSNRKSAQWREKREVVADVTENAVQNMQTIAELINHPEPDVDIEAIANTRAIGFEHPSDGGAQ